MSSKSPSPSKSESDTTAKVPSKSKVIKRTHKALVKALQAHVEIVAGGGVSIKKAERAGAKVASAAANYADAVQAKTGLESPFVPGSGMLASETIQSLRAERVQLDKAATAEIATIPGDAPAPHIPEA